MNNFFYFYSYKFLIFFFTYFVNNNNIRGKNILAWYYIFIYFFGGKQYCVPKNTKVTIYSTISIAIHTSNAKQNLLTYIKKINKFQLEYIAQFSQKFYHMTLNNIYFHMNLQSMLQLVIVIEFCVEHTIVYNLLQMTWSFMHKYRIVMIFYK